MIIFFVDNYSPEINNLYNRLYMGETLFVWATVIGHIMKWEEMFL